MFIKGEETRDECVLRRREWGAKKEEKQRERKGSGDGVGEGKRTEEEKISKKGGK